MLKPDYRIGHSTCSQGSIASVASTAKTFTVAATSGVVPVKTRSGFTARWKGILLVESRRVVTVGKTMMHAVMFRKHLRLRSASIGVLMWALGERVINIVSLRQVRGFSAAFLLLTLVAI